MAPASPTYRLGRYEVLEELGHGAMGTVYRARDPKIDREVAIKTIHTAALAENAAEYRERFFREAQAAGKLSHPGIVTIYDVGEDETSEMPYIVMEYVEGETLHERLSAPGAERLPVEQALELVRQVAEALDYAHARGVVHRDVKPANIMVTRDARALIADFGIAKLSVSELTAPGRLLGTPSYASPEQLGGGAIDGRSDLFSLGVILYLLLTGERPFAGDTFESISFKIFYKDPVPASQLNRALGPDFDYVLERVLAKDPAGRYGSGREFAGDLDDLRRGRPPRSRASAPPHPALDKTVLLDPRPAAAEEELELTPEETRAAPPPGPRAGVPQQEIFPQWASALGHALQNGWRRARRLPRKLQAALALGAIAALAVAAIGFDAAFPAKTAILSFTCQHGFRSADLAIWVDDALVYEALLTGTPQRERRLFGGGQLFGGASGRRWHEGQLSEMLRVRPGRRRVRVSVSAAENGYKQVQEIEADFFPRRARILVISFSGRARELSLALR